MRDGASVAYWVHTPEMVGFDSHSRYHFTSKFTKVNKVSGEDEYLLRWKLSLVAPPRRGERSVGPIPTFLAKFQCGMTEGHSTIALYLSLNKKNKCCA